MFFAINSMLENLVHLHRNKIKIYKKNLKTMETKLQKHANKKNSQNHAK